MRLEASRPLIVTYDEGAASALDIAGRIARPVVVVLADSAHAQRMRPLFADACLAVHDLCEDDLTTKLDRHRPAGIQTFSEPLLPATSALAEALGLPFHDAAVVAALTRKDVQRQVLRAAGVDRTACVRLTDMRAWDDAIAQVGVPAVVKPACGVSSRNTVLVYDVEAGRALARSIVDEEAVVVVEEYLHGAAVPEPWGDYVSVETIVQHGDARHLAVTGKLRLAPPFRECGQFWPARMDAADHAEVLRLAGGAAEALGVVSGLLHTEIKLTPAGPRIIEVNGRIGGYIHQLARQATGIDLIDVGARIACGERVELPDVDLDRIHLQFTTPGPVERGVVSEVCRKADLAEVPGLVSYTPLVRRGDIVGGFATQDLNLVSVTACGHDALVPVVDMILDRTRFGFEIDTEHVTRSARDLIYTALEDHR
jgi:biotin carboxylase